MHRNALGSSVGRAAGSAVLLLAVLAGCGDGEEEPADRRIEYSDIVSAEGQLVKVGRRYGIDGYTASDSLIAVSTDGTTWQITELPETGGLDDVAFGNGRWLAVGSELVDTPNSSFVLVDAAFTATTGGEWQAVADPPDAATALAYGAGRFVAAGNYGLTQSVDGEAWTPIADTETLWWDPGVEFVAQRFVAFGEGPALLDSIDGVTWAFFDTGLTAITEMAEQGDGIVGSGYYDCCFGEEPGGEMEYEISWTAEAGWTLRQR